MESKPNSKTNILHVESWSVESVCEWLKGCSEKVEVYIKNFQEHKINGKKLQCIEHSDLIDMGIEVIDHRITIYNLIQNLIRVKFDLEHDTLNGLIFNTRNRVICLLRYIEKIEACNCHFTKNECNNCSKLRHEIFRMAGPLTLTTKKLLSWLARQPFTKMKFLDKFRDDINVEMKNILKLFRKHSKIEDFNINLIKSLFKMLDSCTRLLEHCDEISDDDREKISIVYNYCYLEKVIIIKKNLEQPLGLTFAYLLDATPTVCEILKESASDECPRLNVGDDILAINNQVIVGWSSAKTYKYLSDAYAASCSFVLLLRKMPKENLSTIKQQRIINNLTTLPREKKRSSKDCKKHSIADVFSSDQDLLDDTSDEENNDNDIEVFGKAIVSKQGSKDSRRIHSMQNLTMNKSNSEDMLDNISKIDSIADNDKSRKKSDDSDSSKADTKSETILSNFFNKTLQGLFKKSKSNFNSSFEITEPSTPSLLHIRKLDSIKMDRNALNKVSSKPPLDKKVYKSPQKQRPIYQSWLYKRKPPSKSKHKIIQNMNSRWHHYWCILMKDHIIFNKHPDDRTPKDFILLKNFTIQKTKRETGFKIIDNQKNIEHEFYAENCEEFKDWYQHLFDIRIKLCEKEYFAVPNPANSANAAPNTNTLSSTNGSTQCLYNEEPLTKSQISQLNNSSRESSPGASSSKFASRDSSPSFSYPNNKPLFTSDSDCETEPSIHQSSSSTIATPSSLNSGVNNSPTSLKPPPTPIKNEQLDSTSMNETKAINILKKSKELSKNTSSVNIPSTQSSLEYDYDKPNNSSFSLASSISSYSLDSNISNTNTNNSNNVINYTATAPYSSVTSIGEKASASNSSFALPKVFSPTSFNISFSSNKNTANANTIANTYTKPSSAPNNLLMASILLKQQQPNHQPGVIRIIQNNNNPSYTISSSPKLVLNTPVSASTIVYKKPPVPAAPHNSDNATSSNATGGKYRTELTIIPSNFTTNAKNED